MFSIRHISVCKKEFLKIMNSCDEYFQMFAFDVFSYDKNKIRVVDHWACMKLRWKNFLSRLNVFVVR